MSAVKVTCQQFFFFYLKDFGIEFIYTIFIMILNQSVRFSTIAWSSISRYDLVRLHDPQSVGTI